MITHLHTHSYYSWLRGTPSPAQLVEAAVEHGMPALALTDRHGLTGAVEFYETCQQAGIKPILGMEVKLNHRLGSGDLVLLAIDRTGWRSLCRISSLLQTHPGRDPERGLDFDDLAVEAEGLICLTGGRDGLIQSHLGHAQSSDILTLLDELGAAFPERIYIELHDRDRAPQRIAIPAGCWLTAPAASP